MPAYKYLRLFGLASLAIMAFLAMRQHITFAQSTDEQLQLGARLFAENCAVCHGASGEGRIGATLAKDWPSIRPDLTVTTIIAEGIPGSPMPAWSQANGGPLTETEIDALVTYILSWQTGGRPQITSGPPPTPRPPISPVPNVVGDPNRGAVLFDENCVVCHGTRGEGRIGAILAKAWPSVRPDLTIKTTIQNGVPGSKMPAWSQVKGGPLNDAEINDLVAYILSWQGTAQIVASSTVITATPTQFAWLRGWGGVILFVILVLFIFGLIIYAQQKSKPSV